MKCSKYLIAVLSAALIAISSNAQSTGFSAHIGYSPMTFSDGSESTSSTGMRVGITAGNYVSTSVPLFVDYGLNINYIWDDIEEIKLNYVSAEIPVNIGYQLDVQGSSLSFSPYGGLSARVNILAEGKYDGEKQSLFDGDNDYSWKRFQLGLQVGLKVSINHQFFVGYEFNPNVMEICDGIKTTYNTFFVGITF